MQPKSEFGIWNGLVEYSYAVMEAVRAQAVAGFNSMGHGGLEIGGVLYGERRGDVVRVLELVQLECEHAFGPGFVLSEKDAAKFREMTKPHRGMRAVGWYCSHTRTGVALNTNDCAMMERFFGQRGSVALLVKPTRFGSVEATFHVQGSAESGPHFSVPPGVAAAQAPDEMQQTQAQPVPAAPGPAALAVREPVALAMTASLSRGLPWLRWVGLGAALAVIAAWFISTRPQPKVMGAGTPVGLQVYSIADRQMRIEWNREAAAVRAAKAGILEIVDGGNRYALPMSAEQLRTSSLTFQRQSDLVEVHIKLAGGPEERVQMLAPSLPPEQVKTAIVAPAPASRVKEKRVAPRRRSPGHLAVVPPRGKDRAPLKQFQLLEPRPQPATSVTLPDPPAATGATATVALPKLLLPLTSAPVPRSGRMIWTGSLGRHGVVDIEGATAAVGSLSGALPGMRAKLAVLPAELTKDGLVVYLNDARRHNLTEAPGPMTGGHRLLSVWDPERVKQISVLEAPNASNQYARLVLRNEGRSCKAIVVEWRVE